MMRTFEDLQPIRSTLLLVVLTMVFAAPVCSQSTPANPATDEPKPQAGQGAPVPLSTDPPKTEVSVPATPEEMRQAQIEADTKKLYQLSAELRAEVAKTYKESLSVTVLKKAQELEKLAKSLKAEINQQVAAAKRQDQ
jgi:hypothetical protein